MRRKKGSNSHTVIIHWLSSLLPIIVHPAERFDFSFQILLCGPGRLHTHNPPASASRVAGLQVWALVPSLGYFLNLLDLYVKFYFSQSRMLPSCLTSTPCPRCPIQPLCDQSRQPWMLGSLTFMLHHILKSHDTWAFKSFFFLQKFRISAYKSTFLFEMLEWAYQRSVDPICIQTLSYSLRIFLHWAEMERETVFQWQKASLFSPFNQLVTLEVVVILSRNRTCHHLDSRAPYSQGWHVLELLKQASDYSCRFWSPSLALWPGNYQSFLMPFLPSNVCSPHWHCHASFCQSTRIQHIAPTWFSHDA